MRGQYTGRQFLRIPLFACWNKRFERGSAGSNKMRRNSSRLLQRGYVKSIMLDGKHGKIPEGSRPSLLTCRQLSRSWKLPKHLTSRNKPLQKLGTRNRNSQQKMMVEMKVRMK